MTGRKVLTLMAAVLGALGLAIAAAADGTTTFTDPAGDATAVSGPEGGRILPVDITAARVADAAATGLITIEVTAAGFGTNGKIVEVGLNADKNVSTGQPQLGDDYRLVAACCSADGLFWRADTWDGAAFRSIKETSPTPVGFNRNGDVLTWTLGKTDLGGTTGFAFNVRASVLGGKGGVVTDLAPNAGAWNYELSKPPPTTTASPSVVKPVIAPPTTTPSRVVAGKRLAVVFRVARSDNGKPLERATATCAPTLAGRPIAHDERFKAGILRIAFVVPRTAKGKLLTVTATVRAGGASTTRVARFRVL